jgi:gluconolactonase
VARLEPDGRLVSVADRFDGRRLNSPNDLVVAPNGDLLFTDPPFGLPGQFGDPDRELSFSGVYRIGRGGRVALVSRDLAAPNGLALSPSGRTLYVSNADPANPGWVAFDLAPDGTARNPRVFHDGRAYASAAAGAPDGMDIDQEGNLFAAGPGAVYVFAPDGSLLGRIDFGIAVSNTVWGDDGSTLYITASTGVYRVKLRTRGVGFDG